jgi:hypothetical protein
LRAALDTEDWRSEAARIEIKIERWLVALLILIMGKHSILGIAIRDVMPGISGETAHALADRIRQLRATAF